MALTRVPAASARQASEPAASVRESSKPRGARQRGRSVSPRPKGSRSPRRSNAEGGSVGLSRNSSLQSGWSSSGPQDLGGMISVASSPKTLHVPIAPRSRPISPNAPQSCPGSPKTLPPKSKAGWQGEGAAAAAAEISEAEEVPKDEKVTKVDEEVPKNEEVTKVAPGHIVVKEEEQEDMEEMTSYLNE